MHHRLRSGILFLTVLAISPAVSQTAVHRWMLGEILKDKPVGSEITTLEEPGPAIFVPPDLPDPSRFNTTRFENLIFGQKGLYFNIDGTNRVYGITSDGRDGQTVFTRMDSSDAGGYNFGAYVFSYNDTVFSIGGYGYWNYNNQLRYFNGNTGMWDLMPVNRRISVLRIFGNVWLDKRKGFLFYQSKDSILVEGLFESRLPQSEKQGPTLMYGLDLENRKWSILGQLTPETMQIQLQSTRLTSTPFGQLVVQDSKSNYLVCFVDAANNRVLALKDKSLSSEIYHSVRASRPVGGQERPFFYFHDSRLIILSPDAKRNEFRIDSTDLKTLSFAVYEPTDAALVRWNPGKGYLWTIHGALIVLMTLVLWKRKNGSGLDINRKSPELFDPTEQLILRTLAAQGEQSLTTEQLDELMGTSDKSLDLRNKRRSTLIRSINSKFQERFETEEILIQPTRMATDRRMVQYKLVPDQYQIVQSSIILKN